MRISKTVSISMAPGQYNEIEQLAKNENRTLSELVREAPRQYQQNRKQLAINEDLMAALRAVQEDARRPGLDKLTLRQINAEVAATRRQKAKREIGQSVK